MTLADALARNVRDLRRKHGWSQRELAEEAGISLRYLSAVESCSTNPTLDIVERLAKALRVEDPRKLLHE